jgi:hypothetical protein
MVCIAAFIILCLLSVFVGILSIFRRDIGKKYWKVFKKSWGCVWKRVRLQKCETNFKEDVKNSILKKVVLKKPKLVKPISVGIEIISVLIVALTVWSLVEGLRAGLSLYALGTCNPRQPDACIAAAADVCPENTDLNWFEGWGVIFAALPDRWRTWDASDFLPEDPAFFSPFDDSRPVTLDIFDPLCDKCLASFNNQLNSGFFNTHNVALIPYPTEAATHDYRFAHSYLISTYMLAANLTPLSSDSGSAAWKIAQKLFTEYDENGIIWQSVMKSEDTNELMAREILENWLRSFGYSNEQITAIRELVSSDRVADQMAKNRDIIKNRIRITGVPTTIYDGRKHTGLFVN